MSRFSVGFNEERKQDKKMNKLLKVFDEAVDFEEIRRFFELWFTPKSFNLTSDLRKASPKPSINMG